MPTTGAAHLSDGPLPPRCIPRPAAPPRMWRPGGPLDADMAYVGMPTGYANPAAANPASSSAALNVQRPCGGLEFVTYDVSGEVNPRNPATDPSANAHRPVPPSLNVQREHTARG
jgi:hypothetical protein